MHIGIDGSRAEIVHRTGTEWYSFAVIEELKKIIPKEHTVTIYTKKPLEKELAKLPTHWKNRVLRWPFSFLWTQGRFSIEMLLRPPDILFVPSHTLPLFLPKHAVTVIHDVGFAHHDELYKNDVMNKKSSLLRSFINVCVRIVTRFKYSATEQDYHRFSTEHAKKHADTIITVSEFSKKELSHYYHIPEEKIKMIHNGWNKIETSPDQSIHKKIDSEYIFFIGRIEKKKNIITLIDAFALLKKEYQYSGKLVLAGSPGFGYEEIQERIIYHSLTEDVALLGWVTQEQAHALFLHATTFVFPSLYEGFGIPVLEAFSYGVPVVCSNIPALQEIAQDAALFFEPTNSKECAKALHTMVHDPVLQKKYREKGNQRLQEFSWEKTAREIWQVLKNTIS